MLGLAVVLAGLGDAVALLSDAALGVGRNGGCEQGSCVQHGSDGECGFHDGLLGEWVALSGGRTLPRDRRQLKYRFSMGSMRAGYPGPPAGDQRARRSMKSSIAGAQSGWVAAT